MASPTPTLDDDGSLECPSQGLALCEAVAHVMRSLFHTRLDDTDPTRVLIPEHFSRELLEDCYLAVDTVYEAARGRNEYSTQWTLEEYIAAQDAPKGKTNAGNPDFSPAVSPRVNEQPTLVEVPCHVSDSEGKVLAWYLPGLISRRRQAAVEQSIVQLDGDSAKGLPLDGSRSSPWRTNAFFFREPEECQVNPGCVCFSPCWYSQAHPPPEYQPTPSQSMNDPANVSFLEDIQEYNAIMGGVLAIIHPALFETAMDSWKAIYADPSCTSKPELVADLLGTWSSPFTAVSLITNRETPLHKDRKGGRFYLDAVTTFGNYANGRFEIDGLGMRFRYNPGTAVFLNSHTFRHGASRVEGERYCLVSFFRPDVVQNHGGYKSEDAETLPTIQSYREYYLGATGGWKGKGKEGTPGLE